jgi:hypothetical protein
MSCGRQTNYSLREQGGTRDELMPGNRQTRADKSSTGLRPENRLCAQLSILNKLASLPQRPIAANLGGLSTECQPSYIPFAGLPLR